MGEPVLGLSTCSPASPPRHGRGYRAQGAGDQKSADSRPDRPSNPAAQLPCRARLHRPVRAEAAVRAGSSSQRVRTYKVFKKAPNTSWCRTGGRELLAQIAEAARSRRLPSRCPRHLCVHELPSLSSTSQGSLRRGRHADRPLRLIPPNVSSRSWRVKLTDFGVALAEGTRRTARAARCAHDHPMSPEQVLGKPVDKRPTCSLPASSLGAAGQTGAHHRRERYEADAAPASAAFPASPIRHDLPGARPDRAQRPVSTTRRCASRTRASSQRPRGAARRANLTLSRRRSPPKHELAAKPARHAGRARPAAAHRLRARAAGPCVGPSRAPGSRPSRSSASGATAPGSRRTSRRQPGAMIPCTSRIRGLLERAASPPQDPVRNEVPRRESDGLHPIALAS